MARFKPYKNKDGKIVSYQIRVYRGKDASGKELTPYSKSWKVPKGYKDEKIIKRELLKVAAEFELECSKGLVSMDKRTFAEYAEYFISIQERDNKHKTVAFYKNLLPRINESIGSIKLPNLTAMDLNKFYLSLSEPGVRKDSKAVAKESLLELKKARGLSQSQIVQLSGLSKNTVANVFAQKSVSMESARKISDAFDEKIADLFTFSETGEKGLAVKTIHHYHTLIHDILSLALFEGIVPRNVADSARPPKLRRKESDFFEIDELLKIREALENAPSKYRAMLYILIETGCRRGELVGLKWDAIDFKNKEISLRNNLQYSKEKGIYEETLKEGAAHTLSVSDDLIKFLKKYKREQDTFRLMIGIPSFNEKNFLFIQEDGRPMHPDTLYGWMKKFEKANDLPPMHPHKFRHSQASILISSGIDILTVSKRLGHAQTSTTQDIYGHLLKQSDRNASDAIAKALKVSG